MRILFLGNDNKIETEFRNALELVAERNSIFFVYSYVEVVDFVNNKAVKQQDQLDLIVIYGQNDNIIQDFYFFLNNDPQRTYSKRDFNLVKIPVLLILNQRDEISSYMNYGFSKVLLRRGNDSFIRIESEIVETLKKWRKEVIDEMDDLGIKFNSGSIDYTYYFEKGKARKTNSEILSANFKDFPRKLNYYWLEINKQKIEMAIDEYIKLLKRTHSKNKKQEEALYHTFFNQNPHFLIRDSFSSMRHEPEFSINDNESYKPDYTLTPNLTYQTDLNIIEVKLPNEGIVKKSNFHRTLLAKVFGHLSQINDYKDYLEDKEYRHFINRRLGFVPSRIDYSLLIGRSAVRDENADVIRKRWKQFEQDHITLITYDDLYDYQVKFLDRVNLLKVT